jgi:hypothetical protein
MKTFAMFALAATLAVATPTSVYPGHQPRSLGDLPAQVQQVFRREAKGGSVDDLRKETLDGRAVYEGEILVNGKATLLQVDSIGQIVHRGPTHDAPTSHRPFGASGR